MGNLDPCTQNFSSYIILFMYPHNNLDKEETDEVNVSVGLCARLTFQTLIAPIFKLLITTTTLYRRLEMRYNASLLRSRILLFCLTGWKSGARLHPFILAYFYRRRSIVKAGTSRLGGGIVDLLLVLDRYLSVCPTVTCVYNKKLLVSNFEK
jgi:hypothetical protein